jgi:anti-anti-sigma factor
MEMKVDVLDNGVHQIGLEGAFDINGAADVDLRFATLAGSRTKILVDMSKVASLASIGIRTLLVNAKVVKRRGGTFVIAAAQPMVSRALETAGISDLIPTYPDVASAMQAFEG